MRFLPILALCTASALAVPNTFAAAQAPNEHSESDDTIAPSNNQCFAASHGQCAGHQTTCDKAYLAIIRACQQVPACTKGSVPAPGHAVKGKVKGYTATLKLGDQCAGVDSWTMDACVGLFIEFIDQSCKKQYPAEGFQLGYTHAPCDGSLLSLNFGG